MNDHTDTTKETYSEYFQEYIEKFEGNGPRTEDIQEVFEYYKESGAYVVELGCGCGRDAAEIIQYTNRYIGIDYVPEFIEYAKESLPNTTFLTEDIETYTPSTSHRYYFCICIVTPSQQRNVGRCPRESIRFFI